MPLHEWTDRPGWEGMHHLWTTELLRWIKPRLPEGYRAFIGAAPVLAIGAPRGRPDVAVHDWPPKPLLGPGPQALDVRYSSENECAPDVELAVATLDPNTALWVEKQGRLVAAVELISPRNKDRESARETYLTRYLGYLLESVNLLLVDVHRCPIGFSFAERIAQELSIDQSPLPPPLAVSYRVGESAPTGGSYLAIWRRSLEVGSNLPTLPLPLTMHATVWVDLERTYAAAAVDAYVE
jgi:Protein of unknown function (DUF4058)